MDRPLPPEEGPDFSPAAELAEWAGDTFISPSGALHNPDHAHLELAQLGFLWARPEYIRQGRRVLGTAETGDPPSMLSGWRKMQYEQQTLQWFGGEVDFKLTIWTGAADLLEDAAFCALVEHELYHCAQAKHREHGYPLFSHGRPRFVIRGHDVEEFVGVALRYGAVSPELEALGEALKGRPAVPGLSIAAACGTCKVAA